MSIGLQPLIWKNIEKNDKDDIWPKKNFGASLLYLDDVNQYFLIGGNHDAYQNELNNYDLNKEIIKTVDSNPLNFQKAEQNKIGYISQNVSNNYYTQNQIDIYIYELNPEPHWYKTTAKGKSPKPRSFQKCIYITPYIFLFGGVELGPKSENLSKEEMYVLNTKTFEWKQIISNITPFNRTEFQWVKIESRAFLYGGAASPSNKFYDDMWSFKYDGRNLFEAESKRELLIDNIWTEVPQHGTSPGKLKAYSMEYHNGFLYLFGGVNNKGINSNTLYRFDLKTNCWEIVDTKGVPPPERCYHEMALINHETLLIFGGIKGTMNEIKEMYNDVYLFNIKEKIWVTPAIGGIQPSPRIGFSLCCNYFVGKMEIMILGGFTKDNDGYTDKNKNYLKIFLVTENDKNSNYFWTIRNVNYKEEQNDDNFLLQAEKNIYEFKEKIANLEIDTRNKEIANEEMKKEINEHKKKFFQQHGFIEDQSQSLEEQINEQENQKNKMKENYEIDKEITDLKIKLKYIMEKKSDKTIEFFNETCSIFMNYYDAIGKILNTDQNGELNDLFPNSNLDELKQKYYERLVNLKGKLEKFNSTEEGIVTELHRYKAYEKSCEEAFKNEIEKYKINNEK